MKVQYAKNFKSVIILKIAKTFANRGICMLCYINRVLNLIDRAINRFKHIDKAMNCKIL